jgi:glutathione-regulated potassium-efflux system ancillary protein KefG
MKKILILFAHPAFQTSRIHKELIGSIQSVENITLRDLYQEYPDFDIDVTKGQQLLIEHDIIVFQFPLFWYSTPSILKEWQDLVLTYGWAFGPGGTQLAGKKFLVIASTGAHRDAYCTSGHNQSEIRELLLPLERTAQLCNMEYYPPFVIHNALRLSDSELAEFQQQYQNTLQKLQTDSFPYESVAKGLYLNQAYKLGAA